MKRFSIRPVIDLYWHALTGDPVKNAYDRVQDAVKAVCRRAAEVEYHKRMVAFYDARTRDIDPYVDHVHAQDFADAMKSRHDHELDRQAEHNKLLEAEAQLDALQAKHLKLKNGEKA